MAVSAHAVGQRKCMDETPMLLRSSHRQPLIVQLDPDRAHDLATDIAPGLTAGADAEIAGGVGDGRLHLIQTSYTSHGDGDQKSPDPLAQVNRAFEPRMQLPAL
jgi:hypothetical protein